MQGWKIVALVLLFIGLGVAVISAYKASVDGLMKKVGLVGSDFSVTVVREKIANSIVATQSSIACDLPSRITSAVQFILSSDQEQGQLAFRLGESRIHCGERILAQGNTEVGTYEILKGMGYLKQGYAFVQSRIDVDRRVCVGMPDQSLTTTVNDILDATSGKIYELIWNDWQKVVEMKKPLDAACIDQRMQSR
jgi:hypothetical protein